MTVEVQVMATLSATDRCDRCGARAVHITQHQGGLSLLWCEHHHREHKAALALKALDTRETLGK